jgi:hypothetical protein
MERYTDTISGEELYTNISSHGDKIYFKDKDRTIRHRIDGPAFNYINGFKAWYVNDKRHRLDGPAIVYHNESKAWYVDGVFIIKIDKAGKTIDRME